MTRSDRRLGGRALPLALVAGAAAVLVVSGALPQLPAAFGIGTAGTARLGRQIPVTAADLRADRANNSPLVVADPGDGDFLALANRLDAPDYSCSLHVSGDGGRRWTPVQPVPDLPVGVEKCYGPEVAIDGRGRIFFSFLGLAGPGNLPVGMYLASSSDRGRTFSAPRKLRDGLNFAVRMAIDPHQGDQGRIHLVWLHAEEVGLGSLGSSDNPILTSHSDDGGETFSDPIRVNDDGRRRVVAPALALGPDHAVHVGYYDLGDDARDYQGLEGPTWEGTWELVVTSSFDGGASFGPGVVAEPGVVPHERVMVIFTMPPAALVAGGKRVCVAWTDARNGDADVLARCSPDRGRTWQPERRVNDDPVSNGLWQYMPALAMSPGGRLDAIYFDRRDDQQNLSNDVTYTYSRDGGRSFSSPVRLTTTGKSLTLIGQQYAVPSAGDRFDFGFRITLRSTDGGVFAAWTDTHDSPADTKAQDIFATTVTPPAAGSPLAIAAAAAAAVLLVGAAGLVVRRRRQATAPEESIDDAAAPGGDDPADPGAREPLAPSLAAADE